MKVNKSKSKPSVSSQMRSADDLGSKVAIIMNEARKKANKLLSKSGYCINVNVDFCKLVDEKEEVLNG